MACMDTTMLLKFFGISEPSAATKRRRSCRARSEGELLRFESVGVGHERELRLRKGCRPTVHTLCDGDNVECLHPCQAFLQLLHEDSEGSL